MTLLGAVVLGYLLGSIPFGLLLTQAAGLGDVRRIGSGNIGATNVLRTGNTGLAAATLLLDGLKGTAAVLLGSKLLAGVWHLQGDTFHVLMVGLLAGTGALLGHIFPVWLRFKGGKGVATFIGVVFALAWPLGLVFCLTWLAVAAASRYSSLAALVATGATVAAAFVGARTTFADTAANSGVPNVVGVTLLLMALLIVWKHRDNISRLLAGTESRIGAKG